MCTQAPTNARGLMCVNELVSTQWESAYNATRGRPVTPTRVILCLIWNLRLYRSIYGSVFIDVRLYLRLYRCTPTWTSTHMKLPDLHYMHCIGMDAVYAPTH